MTKEQLQDRIKLLEDEQKQIIGSYTGAIADCRYWLDQLEKQEKPAEPEKKK